MYHNRNNLEYSRIEDRTKIEQQKQFQINTIGFH